MQAIKIAKTDVPQDKIPGHLPDTIPFEKNAKILQNFSSTTDDGRTQSTRNYVTTRTLADNLKIFTQYLKSNGWTISATIDKEKSKLVVGTKENATLQIEMNTDVTSGDKTVSISLTEFTK